jgi:hypothetical protein
MKWKWKQAEIERYQQECLETCYANEAEFEEGKKQAKDQWQTLRGLKVQITDRSFAEKGNGWEMIELFLVDDLSIKNYQGDDGGILTFMPSGSVGVTWNQMAAIASAHGSGNRKARITVSKGKRKPPEAAYLFERIQEYRQAAIDFDWKGYPFPKSSDDPGVTELLSDDLRQPAWTMMSAVLNGDSTTLRTIANMVELAEKIRLEGKAFTPTKSWEDIAEAIRLAAEKVGSPPSRQQVLDEYQKIDPKKAAKNSIVEDLGRMGFGWLGGKNGRPRKPKIEKPTKAKPAAKKTGTEVMVKKQKKGGTKAG